MSDRHFTFPSRLVARAAFVLACAFAARPQVRADDTKPSSPVTPAPAPSSPVKPAATPAGATFDSFRLVADRNIFDPNRVGRITRGTTEPAAPRGDTISLVGTMQYTKGYFAFFDSPDPKYKKTLSVGGMVAEYTVKQIGPEGVQLERDGKPLPLRVNQQLRRPEGGEWSVSTIEVAVSSDPSASSARPDSAAAIPAGASDVLKRLMEQRQKQLKQ